MSYKTKEIPKRRSRNVDNFVRNATDQRSDVSSFLFVVRKAGYVLNKNRLRPMLLFEFPRINSPARTMLTASTFLFYNRQHARSQDTRSISKKNSTWNKMNFENTCWNSVKVLNQTPLLLEHEALDIRCIYSTPRKVWSFASDPSLKFEIDIDHQKPPCHSRYWCHSHAESWPHAYVYIAR